MPTFFFSKPHNRIRDTIHAHTAKTLKKFEFLNANNTQHVACFSKKPMCGSRVYFLPAHIFDGFFFIFGKRAYIHQADCRSLCSLVLYVFFTLFSHLSRMCAVFFRFFFSVLRFIHFVLHTHELLNDGIIKKTY